MSYVVKKLANVLVEICRPRSSSNFSSHPSSKTPVVGKALTPFLPLEQSLLDRKTALDTQPELNSDNLALVSKLFLKRTMDSDEINTQSAFRQKSPRAKHNRHVSFEVPVRQRKDSTSGKADAKDSDDEEFIDPREAKPSAVCHTLRHCNTYPLN